MELSTILVVDDESDVRDTLAELLVADGCDVAAAGSGEEALDLIRSRLFDAVIADLRMPGMDGLELLRQIKEHDPAIEVIVMTAYQTVETAIEALKRGAYDYISKPINAVEFCHLVTRMMEQSRLRREVKSLRMELGRALTAKELTGVSPAMVQLKNLIERVAPTSSSVMIEGESGTGKELVAAAIHRRSTRAAGPFVPVNCGAIPTDLLESEFFGHVRGAFSGAVADVPGLFRSAHGGTIFLDEVAELPPALQTKLLRVLQDNEVRPVGSSKTYLVDVRVVAATNRPLEEAVREGRLRQDLFYRLNVVGITVPPLRERRTDIPALVRHFLRQFNQRFNRRVQAITPDAMTVLMAHDFPGNVRELEHLIERAFALGARHEISIENLPALPTSLPPGSPAPKVPTDPPALNAALAQVERELILRALELHGGDREKAARALSISPRTLHRRLKEHHLL